MTKKWELNVTELRRHRVSKGWTQQQLADALHVSVSAVCDWENGKRKPHPKRFKQLAEKFGVNALAFTRVISPEPLAVAAV